MLGFGTYGGMGIFYGHGPLRTIDILDETVGLLHMLISKRSEYIEEGGGIYLN